MKIPQRSAFVKPFLRMILKIVHSAAFPAPDFGIFAQNDRPRGHRAAGREEKNLRICAGRAHVRCRGGHAATDEMSWDMRCTTGGAGGNRGFSAMMLVERHRNGIAKVCDVRKHGTRLAALSTFFPRARLGCAAQATLYPPLYITNLQKRSPKRTFRGSSLCMGDGSAITQCPEPSWRWRPSGSRQRSRRASCCPAGRTRRRRRSRP